MLLSMREMPFENIEVDVNVLPAVEEAEFVPVERRYANVLYISTTFFFLLILLGLFVLIAFQLGLFSWISYAILLIWLVLYLSSLGFATISVRKKAYLLRQHDVSYREGVFFKSWTTIPFSRVQHCEIIKGVVDNMMDLVELRVFTAGGSTSDLVIPGLKPEVAFVLKDHIIGKISGSDEEE